MEKSEPWTLKVEKYSDNNPVVHYKKTHKEGGMNLVNPDPDSQTGVVDVFKKMTGKLIAGASLMELTPPSNMLAKASHLEIILKDFSFLIAYAIEAVKVKDPAKRIKLLTAGFVGGVTTVCRLIQGSPPITSLVGETCQAVMDNGTKGFIEQVGRKRLDTRVFIVGPNEDFKITTHYMAKIKISLMNPNNISGQKCNPVYLNFKDGAKYSLHFPPYEVEGVMAAQKHFSFTGSMFVKDLVNEITSEIRIIPAVKKGMLSGWFSKAPEVKPKDINKVIIEIKKGGNNLSLGSGNYTSFCQIDGQVYWRIADVPPKWNFTHESLHNILPSSVFKSEFRNLVFAKKYEEADNLLTELQAQDLRDLRLRTQV